MKKKFLDGVKRIKGITIELMYLVEGDERVVVIDSGVGCVNLKEFVKRLTYKQVFLILTHGPIDHVLAALGMFVRYLK